MDENDRQPDEARDLLSSVCHDLKEPLASMSMGVALLRRLVPDDNAAAVRVIETLQRAVARMDQRVATFSDLGRLEAGVLTLDLARHEVGPLVEAAREQLVADAGSRPLTICLDPGADFATLSLGCDRPRLLQALRNVGACIVRVAPDGSSVSVGASADAAGSVRFEVAARGSAGGRPFAAPLPSPELTIAKGLTALHGGSLAVARQPSSLIVSVTIPPPSTAKSVG